MINVKVKEKFKRQTCLYYYLRGAWSYRDVFT